MDPKKENEVTASSKTIDIITDVFKRCLICKLLPVYF